MLGRGAAGVVFKSVDTQSGTTVAVKQIAIGKMKKQKVSELTVVLFALHNLMK